VGSALGVVERCTDVEICDNFAVSASLLFSDQSWWAASISVKLREITALAICHALLNAIG